MAEPTREYITQTVKALLAASTWDQKKRIVETQRDILLTEVADQVFVSLLEQSRDDAGAVRLLEEHRDLLERCRRDGIEMAFASYLLPESLQDLLAESERLTRPDEMPRKVEVCRAALRLINRDTEPQRWGDTQNLLAKSFRSNPVGDRAYNVAQAIFHYEQALTVFRREVFADQWARTKNNLGNAYRDLPGGDRQANLEQAIACYDAALKVQTREAFPVQWAATQNNLGNAYLSRMRGERAENIEQVISNYGKALEVVSRQNSPQEWATIQNNLANAYSVRIRGERAENIEQAIYHCQQALEVRTRQATPQDWAMTQGSLGNAYRYRIRGERADNLEQAIYRYLQSLEVFTQQAFPQNWAMTQNNLALAYLSRIHRERAENIEQAIYHCQQAFEVRTLQAAPQDWADTQNNLGNAYLLRIHGERAENIEQAIVCYQQALEALTGRTSPMLWADIQNNLVLAYSIRIHGERAENIEQAIAHGLRALEVRTRQALPQDWAATQGGLGNAYLYRLRGERADNLEQAIAHYEQALEVFTRQNSPQQWATTQHNLGNAYYGRILGQFADNLEQAIAHYEQALLVRLREALPEQWAETHHNVANAYLYRVRGERADNVEQAIFHLEQALSVFTREAFPEQWAKGQHNLGNAYSGRIYGERADNLERAILHFQQALEVRTPTAFPQDCRNSAYWLGRLLYDMRRFTEARHALVTAHQAVEALRGEVYRAAAKRTLAQENADLYARLVFCCLQEDDETAAFKYAVASKGRAFVDILSTGHLDLIALGADNPDLANDLQTVRALRQQIDNLLALLTDGGGQSPFPPDVLRVALRVLQTQEARRWEDMAYKYPALTATQMAPVLTADRARALAAELNATLVDYYRHAERWCAFVVTPQNIHHVPLPLIDDPLLTRMVKWVQDIESPTGMGRNQLSLLPLSHWHSAVIAPLQSYLSRGEPVVLSPFSILHLLPLAAARDPDSGRYVAEDYLLAFTPSLAALGTLRDQIHLTGRDGQEAPGRLLNVAYPGEPGSIYYLPNVLQEAQAIAEHFAQVTPLSQKAATPDAVVIHSRDQDVIHFGCHGLFDAEHPELSGLMLAGGWLTVQRIITELQLDQVRVATLGACLSGRAALQSGDEYVGLMQAMLTSGVQTVTASLWKVDDAATRFLFETFYVELVAGRSPAKALQEAARAVRENSQHLSWSHPYYWAAFQISGLAHSV